VIVECGNVLMRTSVGVGWALEFESMDSRFGPGLVLWLGALAVLFAALGPWATCPFEQCSCDAGQVLNQEWRAICEGWGAAVPGRGLALGFVALALYAVGLDAIREGGFTTGWWVGFVAALAAVGLAGLSALQMLAVPASLPLGYGPGPGLYLVAVGALVAAVASLRLRPRGGAFVPGS
jgi:hypothetical protein